MDSPPLNMYETLKEEFWKELGPLDPAWFDILTAQASAPEGSASDQDDLCANQEGNLKTAFDKTAVESQFFSTPKVFRHSRVVSADTDDEQSFAAEQERETQPWTARTPHLFQASKKGGSPSKYDGLQPQTEDSFDLLDTPQKSPASHATRISESLGAHINADISWTSSLNTPPAVPSTLILSKANESPCSLGLSDEHKHIMFVRKLFPSLSNATRIGAWSPNISDLPTVHEDANSPEAGHNPESHNSPHHSQNHSDSVWTEKLPDAVEAKETDSAATSVLGVVENVLSSSSCNSSSSLRKVKMDRIKRKQILSNQEYGCSSTDTSPKNKTVSCEQRTSDKEPCRVPRSIHLESPLKKIRDHGITQWSPLSLSDIPTTSVGSSCHNIPTTHMEDKCSKEQQIDSKCGHPVTASLNIPEFGSTKKKRKFVYSVGTSKCMQEKETHSVKIDSPQRMVVPGYEVAVEQLPNREVDTYSISSNVSDKPSEMQQENVTEENVSPSVQAKNQDFDMSQLCRVFAQDFSQMQDSVKPSKMAEDAAEKDFSPSACLAALKQAKHKARRASPHQEATSPNISVNERTMSDSGFQSAVANDACVIASSALPSSETLAHSRVWTTPCLPSNPKKRMENTLLGAKTDDKLCSPVEERHNLTPGGKNGQHTENMQQFSSTKRAVDDLNHVPRNACGSLKEQTTASPCPVHTSGFKTASNKGIQVSSANLDQAKRLFEEIDSESPLGNDNIKDEIHASRCSENNVAVTSNRPSSSNEKFRDGNCQLTASQKAEVTELCNLFEEADSQFEFPQSETENHNQPCRDNTTNQKPDKDLDPDFLSGIDFDDSFNSEPEKHVMNEEIASTSDGKTNRDISNVIEEPVGMSSATKKEDYSAASASSSSEHIFEAVGFKTAGGNALKVSKECLSKARALFMDLENIVTDENPPEKKGGEADAETEHEPGVESYTGKCLHHKEDNVTNYGKKYRDSSQDGCLDKRVTSVRDPQKSFENGKMGATACQSGFEMASGKGISISAKALQDASAFFKGCEVVDCNDISAKETRDTEALPSVTTSHKKHHPKFHKNNRGIKANFTEDPLKGSAQVENAEAGQCEDQSNSCSPVRANLCSGGGFSTASGKKVSVSAEALTKAERLLNEVDTEEGKNKPVKQGNQSRTGLLHNQSTGFHTAGGKQVAVSSAALRKAKALMSEFGDETDAKSTPSKITLNDPSHRNIGFSAASGKPVPFSSEALQKAKALFDDISSISEDPAVSGTKMIDNKQMNPQNRQKINCGFITAGGAVAHVSQKSLPKDFDGGSVFAKAKQEADGSFKDCDFMESNDDATLAKKKCDGSVNEKRMNLKCSNIQDVRENISAQPLSGCPEGENSKTQHHNDVEADNGSFINRSSRNTVVALNSGGFYSGDGQEISVSDDEVMSLFNESFTFEDTTNQPNQKQMQQIDGFQKGSGKPVTISSAALHRAKSLFDDCDNFKDKSSEDDFQNNTLKNTPGLAHAASSHLKPFSSTSENPGVSPIRRYSNTGGFHTASSKKASVSADALTKAKSLLNGSATFEESKKQPKPKGDNLPPQSGGFHTASGKGVTISSAALKKAQSLFNEIEAETDIKSTCKVSDPQPKSNGFLAASGKPVAVSTEALQRAKALFDDISVSAEIPIFSGTTRSHELELTSPCDTHKAYLSKVKNGNGSFNAVKAVPPPSTRESDFENKRLQDSTAQGCSFIKARETAGAFHFKSPKCAPSSLGNLKGQKVQQTNSSEFTATEESSSENLNLLNLTESQQRLFAQEALDCTKAPLQDESQVGPSMTFENMPQQDERKTSKRSVEEEKRKGKRSTEDTDLTDQPPLKRRLLDEFDRTLDSPKESTLKPEKSCPSGVMKDRSFFKYSASLQPNITRPHRDVKADAENRLQKATEQSTPGDGKSCHSKTPAFVPPFLKNTSAQYNKTPKDNRRTPSAFVPPFKKQRTVFQKSSPEPHEEENKHHRGSITPLKSNTFVPPYKKTYATPDASFIKFREDIKIVSLADPTNNDVLDNQEDVVGCGSKDSAEEASELIQNLENIQLARDMQDMRIRKKKRLVIKPLPGSLFLTKTSGVPIIRLKDAMNGKCPAKYTQQQLYGYGVHPHVSEITSEKAESFRFRLLQFLKKDALTDQGGVQLADGGWLIPSNDGTAGKEEFYRALCDTPGVDPKLISEEWVYNHYRWIVWKQASMERSFPKTVGSLCLAPEQVLLQLKYRYDVEVDQSRRPALRKIMEKDDTAAKTLVLCVCGVVSSGPSPSQQSHDDPKTPRGSDARAENPCAVAWLTDGWYAIKAQLDDPLTAMLHKGRLAVGGKLIVHGAQLVGSQDACTPLEAPESLMLKICANSSRPARWDTKLGFYRDPRPFLLPLSSLYINGGPVGCVDVVILRTYPIQWMERKPDGGVVFRSDRAEEKEVRSYNSHKQKAMETLFVKIQAEFEKEERDKSKAQRRRTISREDVAGLQDGEELYEAVGEDPAYLEALLSKQQLETLHSYRQKFVEKKQFELQDRCRRALEEDKEGNCPTRDVTPVWRLCVADSLNQNDIVYQLNLWRPTSDLQSLLKEGCRYKVYNLTTSDGKKRSGVAPVQLTGTKKTQYEEIETSQEWLSAHFHPRVSTSFLDLQNLDFQSVCEEVDLTGCVISIIDGQGSSSAFYLVDGNLNFVKVRCFSSLQQSALADVVKPRVLLALSNAQLRGQSTSPTAVIFAGDFTVFSSNPKEKHLQESIRQLRTLIEGQENFFFTAEERLSHLLKSSVLGSISSPALQPRTPVGATGRQDTKTCQPIKSLGSFTPVGKNPPTANASTEKDPTGLKRRRALDYLSRIPSPPPLFPLGSAASPCVHKTFNPPRRSGTPSTLKAVQTPVQKPIPPPVDDEWVKDEELAMIDTQALRDGDVL